MKNVLRLFLVTLFSVYVSAVVVQAQNYDLVSDSLAFVAASWKVTPLERGGSAMYAQVNMFNSRPRYFIGREKVLGHQVQ